MTGIRRRIYWAGVEEYDWDEHNEEHVQKHGLEPWEVEDALCDPARLAVAAYNTQSEKRWAIVASTEDGSLLFAVFTKRRSAIRVVMARPASPREARRYRNQD